LGREADFEPMDLGWQGHERLIGSYLLETEDGPALVDCGPATCVGNLRLELAARGLALADVRHLLLTHIHLDHAGAAGVLVREHPGLQVHVSQVGAPHLVEPARLERSARRLYGDAFDALFGGLVPVPEANVHEAGARVVGLECFATPGHASHHVCYLDGEGLLYTGDAAGVRIQPSRTVLPPTPPPEFDLDAWRTTLDEIERRSPVQLALIHFGVASDPREHVAALRVRLEAWSERVRAGASEDEFVRIGLREAGEDAGDYDRAMPLWQSYAGLKRYWDKRAEGGTG
jgi:glyoxylase-like metal-dependent hydrolase (beta-lactamase superfamily II)